MTMKPKAERFRIRHGIQTDTPESVEKINEQSSEQKTPQEAEAVSKSTAPKHNKIDNEALESIRNEGLTGRQLRMARRVAEKEGLAFSSDFEAVKLLRDKGIDPFQKNNLLDLVTAENSDKVSLPQKITPAQLPVRTTKKNNDDLSPAERRAREVSAIQRDLTRRRRRNTLMLCLRLVGFVLIPTFVAWFYYSFVATPMYSTKSAFQIIKSGGSSGGGGMSGLLAGTGFATTTDSIAVQAFLTSKEAMVRLDKDVGFKKHFSGENIDALHRLNKDATNEEAYKVYKKRLKIGFDPTEGIVRMEMVSADPEIGVQFSEALLRYGEEKVDSLSQRSKENQVSDALIHLAEAEEDRINAQEVLVALQSSTMLDPEAYAASLRGQISSLEQQILEKQIELSSLLDNLRPNKSRVDGVKSDIKRLNFQKAEKEAEMMAPLESGLTLAELLSRIQMAQQDLATRDMMFQTSLEEVRSKRAEASAQSLFVELSVEPIAAQDASYPRVFEDTLIVLFIMSGIYLLISITGSILREQLG